MARNRGWLELVDLFFQPTPFGRGRKNEQGGFAFFILFILILVFGLFAVFNYESDRKSPSQSVPAGSDAVDISTSDRKYPVPDTSTIGRKYPVPDVETCRVERCVDGDTIIVISREGRERVRFIGCDTPETVKPHASVEPFGPEAAQFTQQRIRQSRNIVTLRVDGDRTDKYGRRLALVWLGETNPTLLNEELIRNGLARATVQYNFSRACKDRFLAAEQEARKERRGIWQHEPAVSR